MKIMVSLLLTGVMVLSLAACGGNKSTTSTVSTTEPAKAEAENESQSESAGG